MQVRFASQWKGVILSDEMDGGLYLTPPETVSRNPPRYAFQHLPLIFSARCNDRAFARIANFSANHNVFKVKSGLSRTKSSHKECNYRGSIGSEAFFSKDDCDCVGPAVFSQHTFACRA